MSVTGDIVEVRVQSRGSQLVGDHTSGASSIVVADPTDFDTAGGMLRIDGTVYTWTSVTLNGTDDEATATLAITPNLAANEPDTMPVELWSGAQVIDDVVLTVDAGGDTPAYVSLRSDQRKDWTALEGYLEPPVPATFSDDFSALLDTDGYTPTLDASAAVDLPDAPTVAQTAPTAAPPVVVSSYGGDTLVLTAVGAAYDTTLDWYLYAATAGETDFTPSPSTLLAASSRLARFSTKTLADGITPVLPGVPYLAKVRPSNAAGTGPYSAAGSGQVAALGDDNIAALSVSKLQAGTLGADVVLAALLQVGTSIAISPAAITITQTDGRQTIFASDGTGNYIVGGASLDTATILGLLALRGGVSMSSTGTLEQGVADPQAKAVVTPAWDSVANSISSDYRSLLDNGTTWITTAPTQIRSINKSTGTVTSLVAGFSPVSGGITKIGTSFYLLLQDYSTGNWEVRTYSASWTVTNTWAWAPNNTPNRPAITNDGTNVVIAWMDNNGTSDRLAYRAYDPATGTGIGSATTTNLPKEDLCAAYYGTLGGLLGGSRLVVTTASGALYVISTAGVRQTAEEWPLPASPVLGLAYGESVNGSGSAVLQSLTKSKVYHHTSLTGTRDFVYDYRDTNATGGTARTKPTARATLALPRLAKAVVGGITAPPDDGTTDGANGVGIYVGTVAGTLYEQTELTSAPWTATYSTFGASGQQPASSNGFAARPGAVGRWVSAALDGSNNPKLDFRGTGVYALNGTWTLETSGTLTAITGLAVSYRVVNGKVRVKCTTTGTPTIATGTTTVATGALPSGLRPATIETGSAVCQGQAATLRVNTDGTVSVIQNNAASRNTCDGNVEYDRP